MREAVVETTLDLEQILRLLEELDVALGEGFEALLVGSGGGRASERRGDPADGRPCAEEGSERGGRAHGWWLREKRKWKVKLEELSVASDRFRRRGVNRMSARIHFPLDFLPQNTRPAWLNISYVFYRIFCNFSAQTREGGGRRTDAGSNHPPPAAFLKRSWLSTTYKPPSTFVANDGRRYVFSQHILDHGLHRQRVPP